jgi:hypothetical protein
MAIVTTVPKKGEASKAYEIPDDELSRYQEVEAQQTQYEGAPPEGADKSEENQLGGAGALDMEQLGDVQAYSHICICWIRIGRRWYYRYQYCWQSCP